MSGKSATTALMRFVGSSFVGEKFCVLVNYSSTLIFHKNTLLATQHNYKGAGKRYERSLAIRERGLGSEHPLVASSLNNWSELLKKQVRAVVIPYHCETSHGPEVSHSPESSRPRAASTKLLIWWFDFHTGSGIVSQGCDDSQLRASECQRFRDNFYPGNDAGAGMLAPPCHHIWHLCLPRVTRMWRYEGYDYINGFPLIFSLNR